MPNLTWWGNKYGHQKKLGYRPSAPTYATPNDDANGGNVNITNSSTAVKKSQFEEHNSCVVLYQTPVVHMNKKSLGKGKNFRSGGQQVCKYFRENYRIHWAIKSVYEVFVAPV
mmetsp:Transcript_21810/g.33129  ORF Transcript_21810/g.33129 Transcript_21810/m.33129 type:complete len:113 (+) Transcript_21810:266-604(+)